MGRCSFPRAVSVPARGAGEASETGREQRLAQPRATDHFDRHGVIRGIQRGTAARNASYSLPNVCSKRELSRRLAARRAQSRLHDSTLLRPSGWGDRKYRAPRQRQSASACPPRKRIRHDKQAYKDRNVIERCYCRLKDFRRIATRYDKLARNYFSALCLVAAVAFWL